jgi:hypothetical protein
MKGIFKKNGLEKNLFRRVYCSECQQTKPCQFLSSEKCCACFYHQEREKAQEYSPLEKVLADRKKELESRIQQLKLL